MTLDFSLIHVVLFLLGACLGGQLNRAVYRWAWNKRLISPWSAAPAGLPRRTWRDRIPIVGWWYLRREHPEHGSGFWLRPMLIEIVCGLGLPALYGWEIGGHLLPVGLRANPPAGAAALTYANFFTHTLLFALMIIATFIDLDEKTIPDEITIPGTLLALLLSSYTLPPVTGPLPAGAAQPEVVPVLLTHPDPWSGSLDSPRGLGLALFCWLGWIYGVLPKTIYFRRGLVPGTRFLVASMLRNGWTVWLGGLAVIGSIAISAAWFTGAGWQTLLSSLVGLLCGGGLIWGIRVVAGYVMAVEAMGFGDVLLMAMIGAFIGWQATLMSIFFAFISSVVIALLTWMLTGKKDLPFGPYLCAGTAIVVIGWSDYWEIWVRSFSFLGLLIPAGLAVCILAMGVMLWIIQLFKRLIGIA